MTIPLWSIPSALTILVWLVAFLWPIRGSGRDYDFGAAFQGLLHAALAVIATLVIWLVFFIFN